MALQRQLAAPTYLVAFALACIPPVDAIMQTLPLRIHDPRWRFGAFGLLSNAMMIPLTGLLIAFITAAVFDHRALQRLLGIVSLIIGVVAAGALIIFGLDALQVRQQVQPVQQLAFRVASTTAVTKSLLGIITLGAFGLASFSAPRSPRRDRRRPDLIVGRGAGIRQPASGERIPEGEPASEG